MAKKEELFDAAMNVADKAVQTAKEVVKNAAEKVAEIL